MKVVLAFHSYLFLTLIFVCLTPTVALAVELDVHSVPVEQSLTQTSVQISSQENTSSENLPIKNASADSVIAPSAQSTFKKAVSIIAGIAAGLATFAAGLILLKKNIQTQVRKPFKSIFEVHMRLLIGAVSLVVALLTGTAVSTVFPKQLAQFEQVTQWQLGPLKEDLIWMGGTLAVLIATLIIVLNARVIGSALTAVAAAARKTLPKSKSPMDFIFSYLVDETKSAFTETEKECKARDDECKNFGDKMIILFFNYLPGTMPDLGMGEYLINWKNKMLGIQPPEPVLSAKK
jgi:hypothetical protein